MANKLEVILSVVKNGFENFDSAGNKIDNLKTKTNSLSSATSILSKSFLGVLAPIASVGAAIATLNSALNLGDSIRKQADMLSMSTTAVQEWNYVAKQSGVESGSLTNAFSKLTQNIYSAQTGNKELARTFKDWNVELTDSKGNLRTVTDITNDTMSALAGIKDPIERAGVAQQLLGKGAKELAPLLAQGTEALNDQKKAAHEHGQVLSEQAVDALDQAGDKLDEFTNSMKIASAEMISNGMPAIQDLSSALIELMKSIGDAALGWRWLRGGKEEFDKKMQESDAITKEIIELNNLKKEMEATIAAQEAFKKKGSALFDQDTLDSAKETLRAVNEEIHSINQNLKNNNNSSKPDGSFALREAQRKQEEEKTKQHQQALKKLQQDYQKDREKSYEDAKKHYEARIKLQNEYNKDVDNSYADAEKTYNERQERKRKLDEQIERLSIANEKDEAKRKRLEYKQEIKEIERAYKEQVKAAEGNADELVRINELKNLSIQNANNQYLEWYNQSEKAKKEITKQAINDTLSNYSSMFGQLAEKNKAWAAAYKTTAIAQTIISTYQGAQDSYTSLAKIPYVGVALGIAAAAAAVTAGLLRVNEIRKQNFASGTDGELKYGTWALTGEMGPELTYLPAGSQVYNHHKTNQIINNNQKKSTVLNVYVQSDNGRYDKKFVRELRNGSMDYATRLLKKKMGLKYAST